MTLNSAGSWLARGPLGRVGMLKRVFVMTTRFLDEILESAKLIASNASMSVSGSFMRIWGSILTFLDYIGPLARDLTRKKDPTLRKNFFWKHGDSYRIISRYTAICKWDSRSHCENVNDKSWIRDLDIIVSYFTVRRVLLFRTSI